MNSSPHPPLSPFPRLPPSLIRGRCALTHFPSLPARRTQAIHVSVYLVKQPDPGVSFLHLEAVCSPRPSMGGRARAERGGRCPSLHATFVSPTVPRGEVTPSLPSSSEEAASSSRCMSPVSPTVPRKGGYPSLPSSSWMVWKLAEKHSTCSDFLVGRRGHPTRTSGGRCNALCF